jgi:alkanesulfonate monooxygenase SsuD/methylene tetrahydromethanopterin reductase-like flavin-dependent oxidoreductase (luciferase family)
MQFTAQESAIIADGRARAIVGAPAEAAEQVREVAEHFGVDEVMINPVGSAFRGTAAASAPARVTTLELLAKELF